MKKIFNFIKNFFTRRKEPYLYMTNVEGYMCEILGVYDNLVEEKDRDYKQNRSDYYLIGKAIYTVFLAHSGIYDIESQTYDVVLKWLNDKYDGPILLESEKTYLRNALCIYKDVLRVEKTKRKSRTTKPEYIIKIETRSTYGVESFYLQPFKHGFYGMKEDVGYTSEELGL